MTTSNIMNRYGKRMVKPINCGMYVTDANKLTLPRGRFWTFVYLDIPARNWRKQAIVGTMLERAYPLQKLDTIQPYRRVPNNIVSHIRAMNDLRNIANASHEG
jgi:hypothetical protein